MDHQTLYEITNGALFLRLTAGFALFSLLAAAAVVIVTLWHADPGAGRAARAEDAAPWPVLIRTLRDSFLITLLYLAEALLSRAGQFEAYASQGGSGLGAVLSLVEPFAGFALLVFSAVIAGRAVVALNRWLRGSV